MAGHFRPLLLTALSSASATATTCHAPSSFSTPTNGLISLGDDTKRCDQHCPDAGACCVTQARYVAAWPGFGLGGTCYCDTRAICDQCCDGKCCNVQSSPSPPPLPSPPPSPSPPLRSPSPPPPISPPPLFAGVVGSASGVDIYVTWSL